MKKGLKTFAAVAFSAIAGAAAGAIAIGKVTGERINKVQNMSDKYLALFLMMKQWVKVKQEGKNLAVYFKKNGYENIAIYGMNHAGETLMDELRDTDIEVVYGIDKNAEFIYSDVDIFTMEDDWLEVDAIVVTAITFFDEIRAELSSKTDCPILSLEDILYEI